MTDELDEDDNAELARRGLITLKEAAKRLGRSRRFFSRNAAMFPSRGTFKRQKLVCLVMVKAWANQLDSDSTEEESTMASTTDGALAARAFKLFNAGKSRNDVVIALEVAPQTIQQLFEQWESGTARLWWVRERAVTGELRAPTLEAREAKLVTMLGQLRGLREESATQWASTLPLASDPNEN